MRTISVKEAALALGCTTRTVINRLKNGDLNGQQFANPYGVSEWRIYPTKEIAQKLRIKEPGNPETVSAEMNFGPLEEPIDAETVSEETTSQASYTQDWMESERQHMRILAEEMMRPLLETIRNQERQLEDQSVKLKLLPDFEKQAADERKAAQLKALEAEALRKQVDALKLKNEAAEKAQEQVELLEKTIEERQREAAAEIQKLKDEKEAQLKLVEVQLAALSQTVLELKQPWWKKLFGTSPEAVTDNTNVVDTAEQ